MPELFGNVPGNEVRFHHSTMYKLDDTAIIAIATPEIYQTVLGWTFGATSGSWTFQNGGEMVCGKAGLYLILWHATVLCLDNKKVLTLVVMKNAAVFPTSRASMSAGKNDLVGLSGSALRPLIVGDIVRLGIASDAVGDFVVKDAKMGLVRLDA